MKFINHKTSISFLFLTIIALGSSTLTNVYQFNQKSSMIPHPDKAYRGGQDAFFSSKELMIVADGVGSWADFGVDPGFYSRFLCSKGGQLFEQNKTFYRENLVELIANASSLNTFVGSSTMAVATVYGDKLRTCYLGDSGYVIFRQVNGQYKLHFEFKQQQHGFNFPFQLAMQQYFGDDPYLSICQDFPIEENDIIVMGSDGLFDNVFVTEIMNLINQNKESDEKLFSVALLLAELAISRGKDTKFESPFSVKAKEQMLLFNGGKLDDTTVILAKIKKTDPSIIATEKPQEKPTVKDSQFEHKQILDVEQRSTFEVFDEMNDKMKENMQAQEGIMFDENREGGQGEYDSGIVGTEQMQGQEYNTDEQQKQDGQQQREKDLEQSQGFVGQQNQQVKQAQQILSQQQPQQVQPRNNLKVEQQSNRTKE